MKERKEEGEKDKREFADLSNFTVVAQVFDLCVPVAADVSLTCQSKLMSQHF